jgi:hypothetical protein
MGNGADRVHPLEDGTRRKISNIHPETASLKALRIRANHWADGKLATFNNLQARVGILARDRRVQATRIQAE